MRDMQTFYPSRSKAALLLFGSLAFVLIGLWIALRGDWIGYLVAGFFGLGIPIAIVQLLPGSAWLQLDRAGFTFRALFRSQSVRWSDVEQFFVVSVTQGGVTAHRMVGFNYVPTFEGQRVGRRIASAIAQCESALPDTYGMSAEELAALMNERLLASRSEGTE